MRRLPDEDQFLSCLCRSKASKVSYKIRSQPESFFDGSVYYIIKLVCRTKYLFGFSNICFSKQRIKDQSSYLLDPQQGVLLGPERQGDEPVGHRGEGGERDLAGHELFHDHRREERRTARPRDLGHAHREHVRDLPLVVVCPRAEHLDHLPRPAQSDDVRHVLRVPEHPVRVLRDEHLPLVRRTEVAFDVDEDLPVVDSLNLHLIPLLFP